MPTRSTKEYIIEKANELYLQRGYQNVTVVDICEACNISKTTFYYHLKSKEETILNFYDSLTHNISQFVLTVFSKDNFWEQLLMCFESLIKEAHRYGTDFFTQMMISNLKDDSSSYDFRDELTEVAVMIIKKGQEAGQIRNQNDALSLYRAASYMFLGHEATWCMKRGNFDWLNENRIALESIFDVDPIYRKHESH